LAMSLKLFVVVTVLLIHDACPPQTLETILETTLETVQTAGQGC
jgi:hypothetical protein